MNIDALIFAAGRGKRMGELTSQTAKPALKINSETIISRLVEQVSKISEIQRIFINISYNPISILDAVNDCKTRTPIIFLWERDRMGTGWTLRRINEESNNDLLVIHGDLFVANEGLQLFYQNSKSFKFSVVAGHRRTISRARSILVLQNDGLKVKSFYNSNHQSNFVNSQKYTKNPWSNSGVYLFRSKDLRELESNNYLKSDLTDSILPILISKKRLAMIPFEGFRKSIETPADLYKLRNSLKH